MATAINSRHSNFVLLFLIFDNCTISSDKPDSAFTSTAQLKAKKYFLSCMDEDKLIEKAGPNPLLNLIDGLGWGINISDWDHGWQVDGKWNLNKMLEDVHLLNVASLFSVWVAEDDKNSSLNVLQVSQ